jgi:hypothetical protein
MTNRLEKQSIVDTYQTILNEYFSKFLESDICNIEQNFCVNNGSVINFDSHINCHLFTGITIINRVFEYIFLKTKHISYAYYYSNEAFSYYLEYMEQIYKANLLYNVNHADAIVFVYKKTIFELYENDNTTTVELGGRSIFSNIIESNKGVNTVFLINNNDFKSLFLTLNKTVNLLLCWKDTFLTNTFSSEEAISEVLTSSFKTRINFCQYFLENYFKNIEKIGPKIDCLEILFQRLYWDHKLWKLFLDELLLDITKRNKKKSDKNLVIFLLSFNMEKFALQEKLNNGDVLSILKWFKEAIL